MNEKIRELEAEVKRLKTIAISLKVDVNIRDAKIRDLERELLNERRQVRSMEINTQEVKQLEILGESEDDNGGSPYDTGQYKSPWERVR
jgi:sigma54-dependent transcription regulator